MFKQNIIDLNNSTVVMGEASLVGGEVKVPAVRRRYINCMDRGTRKWIRELAYFSSIGFSVAFSIFIGLAVGLYLDKQYGSTPWMMLVFLLLGIIAGFRNIGLAIKKSRNM